MKHDEIPLISNVYISPSGEDNPVLDANTEAEKQTEHESGDNVVLPRVRQLKVSLAMKDNLAGKSVQSENKRQRILEAFLNAIYTTEAFFIILFVWLEIVFHFARFGAKGENLLTKICFAILFGVVFGTIFGLIPNRVGKITTCIAAFITTLYYIVQIVYSGVFATYLSVTGSIGMTGQAFDFLDVIKKEMFTEWWILVLLLLPFVGYCAYLCRKIQRPMVSWKRYGYQMLTILLCYLVSYGCMRLNRKGDYTAYEIYKSYTSVDLAVKKLGVCESFYVDIRAFVEDKLHIGSHDIVFVEEEEHPSETFDQSHMQMEDMQNNTTEHSTFGTGNSTIATEDATTEEVIDTSPNVLPIDLDELIESESNSNIVSIHEYVQSVTPTNKNEYTGMFEGYNVIFVVAEGFSGYMLDKELTPTLYKLAHEGFYFKNYYTPLWYGSTLGGEYANLTGLMPKNGSYLSMEKAGRNKNDMMFTLGIQLSRQGYKTTGYHNNSYRYYDRHISHPNMGYEWIGVGNGYEPERSGGTQLWPQSDLTMISQTFDQYKDEEPFHTYYLTVSGHVMYNFSGNAMALRHKDFVEDLPYSETTKAYLACQHELELAMTELVTRLEEEGLADHTVIILTADHVPYDNKEICDELAGYTLDSTFEWYKNALIIWSGSMEEPVTVRKYCSSLDVLPTVSNLLGLPYDSRMLVGQDILSDSEGLVIFNDRSFITDKCSYDANTGKVKSLDGSQIDDAYVETKIAQVKNKFNMAESICNYDYYRYIDAALHPSEEEE